MRLIYTALGASAVGPPRPGWQRGRWRTCRSPPVPRALSVLEGSGQGGGTRGAPPSRRECQPRDSEKEPGEIGTLCFPCPKGKEEGNRGMHSSCKGTTTWRASCPRARTVCRHKHVAAKACPAGDPTAAAPNTPAMRSSYLTSDLRGSTSFVSAPASQGRQR